MGSLAVLASQPTIANNASDKSLPTLPLAELDGADYFVDVMQPQQGDATSEVDMERDLNARALALGISIRPHTPVERVNFGAGSLTTVLSNHVRNISTSSNDTTDTDLTTPSSPTDPCPDLPGYAEFPSSPRARSRLTFSQYDKYLAQVETDLDRPKFSKASLVADAPSLFGIASRKSVVSIKNGIKARVRWKRRSSVSCATM